MITDSLSSLDRYSGIHPALDLAIRWLAEHDLAGLPDGITEIDGRRVYVNVMEADTRPEEGAHYEVHRKYIDLQMDLEGSEDILVSSCYTPDANGFDDAADIGFGDGPLGNLSRLGDGMFALFLAGESHMPTVSNGSCTHVKKAVFKILSNEYYDEV